MRADHQVNKINPVNNSPTSKINELVKGKALT